ARLPEHLRPTVRFHGHQDHAQVMSALGRAQVAVFPSYTETFGLCAAEALASGCATVYTKLSCGPEIVRDGVDGLLADPDQPEEIAGAIGSILGDAALRVRLSIAGRRRVREAFDLGDLVAANERFFERIIHEFAPG